MTPGTIHHFVFVDYENVPKVDLGLIAGLPVHVTVLLGKNQKSVPVAFAQDLRRLGADRVSLVEVQASGHNALDIILAYYVGNSASAAPGAYFHIVSNDKDFEPLLGHLVAKGIKASRHDSFAALPFLPRPKKPGVATAPVKQIETRAAGVIAFLTNPKSPNRPSSEKALQALLKTRLGKEFTEEKAAEIVRELIDQKALTVSATREVSYAK